MNPIVKKTKFIEKINDFIKEIDEFKVESKEHWKPDYDFMREELEEIASTANGNMINAENEFNTLAISKFPSFREYVINTDVEVLKRDSGSNSRFKSSRTKRKRHQICPQCGEQMVLQDNQFLCEKCLYAVEVKVNHTGSISGEESKHSNKLLHMIAGVGKPPGSVQKILNFAVTWLTDLKYIKEWFIAHKTRYETFVKNYRKETHLPLTDAFFNRVIERKIENIWPINIYHLLMNEFQQMLEEAKAVSKTTSNMWYMKKDAILEIINKYREENGDEIPKDDVKFGEYDVGAYFSQLSLLAVYPEDHAKAELVKMYNNSLTLPGLSFNFNDVFKRGETVIRRHDLLQGNSWVQRYVFNVPPSTITEAELNSILDIMLQFNVYYKAFWYKRKLKSCNSPLYAVVLDIILNLPAFKKFRSELMMFVQRKELKTRTQIFNTWIRFEQDNKAYLSQFLKADEPTIIKLPKDSVAKEKNDDGEDGAEADCADENDDGDGDDNDYEDVAF